MFSTAPTLKITILDARATTISTSISVVAHNRATFLGQQRHGHGFNWIYIRMRLWNKDRKVERPPELIVPLPFAIRPGELFPFKHFPRSGRASCCTRVSRRADKRDRFAGKHFAKNIKGVHDHLSVPFYRNPPFSHWPVKILAIL